MPGSQIVGMSRKQGHGKYRTCVIWGLFLESFEQYLFGPGKLFCVCCVCIQEQSFNNFENKTMKLSVNEAKLTGLWTRNHATIQLVGILKFAFRPEK